MGFLYFGEGLQCNTGNVVATIKKPGTQQVLWMPGFRKQVSYWTVNVTLFVFPIGVTTATFLALCVAVPEMVNVAVTVVLVEEMPVTVTPPPATVTFVAPARLVPVSVTVK